MITSRDRELLVVLAHRVKLLTVQQIARTWWADAAQPVAAARKRLRQLNDLQHVRIVSLMSHPELDLRAPVASWCPGEEPPNFGAVAYRLQARWTLSPRSIDAVLVSPKAASRFGGDAPRRPKEVEQTHDVHVGSVYLWYRVNAPADAAAWHSESWIRRSRPDAPGEKLPDAIIRSHLAKVVEFGGAYPKRRFEAFHNFCSDRGLPYDLW